MEPILFAMAHNSDRFYYMLCAAFLVGGFVSLYFVSECLQKSILQTWISVLFLSLFGVTMLYYGFASLLDFYQGSHKTLDAFLNNVEMVTRIFT